MITSNDWRQVEPAAPRQHQRLAGGDEVDEREHVRDHLDHRRAAERPDVEDPAADRLEHRQVRSEDRRIAADDDGDLAGGGEVHAAGDRRLEAVDPLRGGERREALELVAVVRARVDPGSARSEPLEQAALAREHVRDGPRRRQAGEDGVRGGADLRGRVGPGRSVGDELPRRVGVAVVHGQREAGGEEVRRQRPAEVAEADEAEAQVARG